MLLLLQVREDHDARWCSTSERPSSSARQLTKVDSAWGHPAGRVSPPPSTLRTVAASAAAATQPVAGATTAALPRCSRSAGVSDQSSSPLSPLLHHLAVPAAAAAATQRSSPYSSSLLHISFIPQPQRRLGGPPRNISKGAPSSFSGFRGLEGAPGASVSNIRAPSHFTRKRKRRACAP